MEVGQIIDDRYEILSTLGQGGFSVVYKARQLSTGQLVALKVLQSVKPRRRRAQDEDGANDVRKARFQREMQLISKLRHPNIVRLVDSGALNNGSLYMVLEFIEGEDLHTTLNTQGALKEREARHLMTQVLDALSCAHMHGVVHRDLKPQNIMITTQGYRRNATVLDFGISAVMENQRETNYMSLTNGSQIHGTPAYMAPEQLGGRNLTPQSDIYAWGLVFLEVLTGHRVMDGENPLEVALRQVNPDPIDIPPHVTRDKTLRYVLERSLAKGLDTRFVSTEEVIAVLEGEDVLESAAHDRLTSSSSSLPTSSRAGSAGALPQAPQSASALVEAMELRPAPQSSDGYPTPRLFQGNLEESLQKAAQKSPDLYEADTMDLSTADLHAAASSPSNPVQSARVAPFAKAHQSAQPPHQSDDFSALPESFPLSSSESRTAEFNSPEASTVVPTTPHPPTPTPHTPSPPPSVSSAHRVMYIVLGMTLMTLVVLALVLLSMAKF